MNVTAMSIMGTSPGICTTTTSVTGTNTTGTSPI